MGASSKKTTASPGESGGRRTKEETYNGVPAMMPYMIAGFVSLTVIYAFCYRMALDGFPFGNSGVETATQFQTLGVDNHNRPDLFAFQLASGVALCASAILGLYGWYGHTAARHSVPSTPAGRLYGPIPLGQVLATVSVVFQVWDFCASLAIPEHRTPLMLGHHLAASTVSYCSLRYGVLQYYGLFFLGLSEVSSVFLVFVDLATYFPPVPESAYDQFVRIVCGPGFVVFFVLYRFLYWWPVSCQLFSDVYHVTVKTDQGKKLGRTWVLYIFLILNLPLGILQLYWLTIIGAEVAKVINPDDLSS